MKAHLTAIISPKAKIADDVQLGAYTIVEEDVSIAQGCVIGPHVHIHANTDIGRACKIHTGVVLGDEPQDLAYKGANTFVKIGENNILREYVTVHRGTDEGTTTTIGDNNYLMAFAHVAHNCNIANNVIICNNAMLAGHVTVEERAFISACCLIHQFVRIGRLSLMAGGVRINRDLPPFMTASEDNAVTSYNIVGLRRSGLAPKARAEIKEAFRIIYRSGHNLTNALQQIEANDPGQDVKHLLEFIRSSKRGICASGTKETQES